MRQVLQPIDVSVGLSIALRLGQTFAALADQLGISPSTAHQAVKRLMLSGLVRKAGHGHVADVAALEEFLLHGVRYAFPAIRTKRQRGVPTAHAAPVFQHVFDSNIDPLVWPSALGTVVGMALEPLLPSAPSLASRHPALYDALALVDAIRVGNARDREVAGQMLTKQLDALAA
jgi:DNA-binding Lrp family transcriptional regulator